jgi:hypothetical protein
MDNKIRTPLIIMLWTLATLGIIYAGLVAKGMIQGADAFQSEEGFCQGVCLTWGADIATYDGVDCTCERIDPPEVFSFNAMEAYPAFE